MSDDMRRLVMAGKKLSRRGFLKGSVVASTGAAALSLEEQVLLAKASEKPAAPAPKDKGLPTGKIGKIKITRLICGGNLIGGWAHSRKLKYVSSLMNHYFTDEKIIETWEICEANGINTAITVVDKRTNRLLSKHWKNGGKIQWIAQLRSRLQDPTAEAKLAVDNGAVGAFLIGNEGDSWVKFEKGLEGIRKIVSFTKDKGLIAGVGGHLANVPITCEKEGIEPDFYFKTINDVKYHCETPAKTIEFMKKVKKPWIAYKVLGAGVVSPTKGFKYALQNGADFMCVGMFDFQIKDDAQIVRGIFARGVKRQRPWRG